MVVWFMQLCNVLQASELERQEGQLLRAQMELEKAVRYY